MTYIPENQKKAEEYDELRFRHSEKDAEHIMYERQIAEERERKQRGIKEKRSLWWPG